MHLVLSAVLDGLEANTADRKNLQIPCHGIVLVHGGQLSTSGKLSPCTVHGIPVCPAVPLKAQLWLVCDRCGTSALCRVSHPEQSHQSDLGTLRHLRVPWCSCHSLGHSCDTVHVPAVAWGL